MTMSVGLARIIVDPTAGVLTRKALGALSTPGLLVHDTGLSIDDDGRIYIKLKPDGGLLQDSDGLYMEPEPIVIGLDSHVDLFSNEHDREWNMRLTGSAPNYIESGLAIGSEEFSGTFTSPDVDYDIPKVSITSKTAQMRIAYDQSSFTQVKVFTGGQIGLFAVGNTPGFLLESGDGINSSGGLILNRGIEIKQIIAFTSQVSWVFHGTVGFVSWQEYATTIIPLTGQDLDPDTDMVTVVPLPSGSVPPNAISFFARVSATNEVTLRMAYYDEMLPNTMEFLFLAHRLSI